MSPSRPLREGDICVPAPGQRQAQAPSIAATNPATGAVLCGLRGELAIWAVLSLRFTDQAQSWAAAPATNQQSPGTRRHVHAASTNSGKRRCTDD
ncbi:MAG: hypothetical protein QOD35_3105 [Nocardioidaceae bacterium]|nr:hypothetical protein [Nocardioidaceae bacterium]